MQKFVLLFIWLTACCHATQQDFEYRLTDGKLLKFQLDSQLLERYRDRIAYKPELAQLYVRSGMVRFTANLMNQGTRIRLSPANMPLTIEVSGTDSQKTNQLQRQLQQEQQRLLNEYLQRHQYRLLQDHRRQSWVIQDHQQHYQQALTDLKPVASALVDLYGSNNIRQVASALTSWVEQIPYQDLQDRQRSPGVGYLAPIELLFQNQGDCDSKAVLWAATMRLIFPNLPLAMVYFDDHAMVGARIPPIRQEVSITHGNGTLLLIDATGPALAPIGQPNPNYLADINNRQFTVADL